VRSGAVGLAVLQPLASFYSIDGDFEVGIPSVGFAPLQDDSDIAPRYGLVLLATVALTERWQFFSGIDFRDYEVEDLQPLFPLLVELEPFSTTQFALGFRYLFAPFDGAARLRPYAESSVLLFPRSDVRGLALVSQLTPGNSDVPFEGRIGPYAMLALGTGLAYQWNERSTFEAGFAYELPLSRPDSFLAVDAFGGGDPADFVVSSGEVDPGGWIVHVGMTWYFR